MNALLQPLLPLFIAMYISEESQMFVLSVFTASTTLGRSFSPIFLGILYDTNDSMPFYIGGVLFFVGFVLMLFVPKSPEGNIQNATNFSQLATSEFSDFQDDK